MNTMTRAPIAITGHAWEIPHLGTGSSLSEALAREASTAQAFAPELTLGKKGLRYKERSTLMALCAAKRALQHAGLVDEGKLKCDDDAFGVVVASNTGNLDTVCNAADTIRREHVNAASSMDLPNASSNVIASTIAIRFALRGLNLMICSGASASLDALILAANAIRNGRAQRMLVATVETDGLAVRSLLAERRLSSIESASPLLEGAGAVILESSTTAAARGASVHGYLTDYMFAHADAPQGAQDWFARRRTKPKYLAGGCFLKQMLGIGDDIIELGDAITDSYGSAALLQLIHACEQIGSDSRVGGIHGAGDGAIIVGGGNWMDRRGGAVVIEAAARPGVLVQ